MKSRLKHIVILCAATLMAIMCSKTGDNDDIEPGYWLTRNPYAVSGTARLVQIHTHTNVVDGSNTPAEVTAFYAGAGYDALALTDHDEITLYASGLISITGSEVSPSTGHVLCLGSDYSRGDETDTQTIIDGIVSDGGIALLNHPNRNIADIEGHSYDEMMELNDYTCIEIHNAGTVVLDNNSGYALAQWDSLLTNKSTRIWGYASDDYHSISDIFGYDVGRLIVFSSEPTEEGILTAIKTGNFVADVSNHGVILKQPVITGRDISLDCPGATAISFYGKSGLLQTTMGETATYTTNFLEKYIRAEVSGSFTEGFAADPDWANRWNGSSGTWSVSEGVLRQTFTDNNTQTNLLMLKKHLKGNCVITCDILYGTNQGDGQAGIIFNSYSRATGYYLGIGGTDDNDAFIYKLPSTILDANRASISNNTWYSLKMEYTLATGTIKAKIWPKDQAEPGTWHLEATDKELTNGFIALRCTRDAKFDNLYINGFKSYYQPITVE